MSESAEVIVGIVMITLVAAWLIVKPTQQDRRDGDGGGWGGDWDSDCDSGGGDGGGD